MSIVSTTIAVLSALAVANGPPAPRIAPQPSPGILLEYQFEVGDVLRLEVEETSHLLAVKGDSRQEQSNQSVTRSHLRVTSVSPEATATLVYRIESARMQFQLGELDPIRFDSDQPETHPIYKKIRRLIGVDYLELEVQPNGTLVAVRSLIEDSNKATAETPRPQKNASGAASIFPVMPDEAVRVGDDWTHYETVRVSVDNSLRNPITKPVKILHRFRLTGLSDGVATIEFQSVPLTAGADPSIQLQVAPRKAEGTIRFDVAGGRVLERTQTANNVIIGWRGPQSSLKTRRTRSQHVLPAPREVSANN